jgi:DNA adenine methylase
MGSKGRIAKHILAPLLAARQPGQIWVEPFVGGANMIDKIGGQRIGNDNNEYLIALWSALQKGWEPPTDVITKEFYRDIRTHKDRYAPEMVGLIGFACSYGGRFFEGLSKTNGRKHIAQQAHDVLMKQLDKITNVTFICGDYRELEIPPLSLIYSDPPYLKAYNKYHCDFNFDEHWAWCRQKEQEGHTVFVSEYDAPGDFEIVAEHTYICLLNHAKKVERTERLFRLKK